MRRTCVGLLGAGVLVWMCCIVLTILALGIWWWQGGVAWHETYPGRLLVLDFDGHIRSMRPDGGDVLTLTENDPHGIFRQEPAWSPDGEWVAWVSEYPNESEYAVMLSLARADGSARRDVPLPAPAVYLAWQPTSEAVAALLPDDISGLSLVLVDRAGNRRTLSRGQPFYFDWSPDGRELLAHIDRRLVVLDTEGHEAMLAHTEGRFAAPDWSEAQRMWAYAVSSAQGVRLVIHEPENDTTALVSDVDGRVAFALSPDDTQMAYILTPPSSAMPTLGPLWLLNRERGVLREVSAAPVLAFFWSPDGRSLAFLRYEFGRDNEPSAPEAGLQRTLWQTPSGIWFRWHIWNGERTYPTPLRFRPGSVYASEYLRFFDQYARSSTFWAPDGSAFVFAGEVEGVQRSGIWVQPVKEGADPEWISTGHVAFWSPR